MCKHSGLCPNPLGTVLPQPPSRIKGRERDPLGRKGKEKIHRRIKTRKKGRRDDGPLNLKPNSAYSSCCHHSDAR